MNIGRIASLVAGGLIALFALSAGCSSLGTVPSGYVGVVTAFGATTGEVKSPGFFVVLPFVSAVERMDTQTHAYKTQAGAASRDLQNVSTEITINFRLDPAGAVKMFNEMRRDYEGRLLAPSVQEAIKATTAQYDAEELITKREEVRSSVENKLRDRLLSHHIVLDQVSITNFAFDPDFAKAIESKVTATQLALKAKNDLERIRTEAEQRIAEARGEAEAIKIQAEAIQHQGGDAYVRLKAIEKWNGQLPQWLAAGAPVPFVNLK